MTSSLDRKAGWMRADHVAWVGSEHRVVVLNLAAPGSAPRALEATSAAIWMELGAAPRTLLDIVESLARAYGTPVVGIQHDVVEFLRRLQIDGFAIELAPEKFDVPISRAQDPRGCA